MSSLELTSLLKHPFRAGALDLLVLPVHSKLSLVGFSQAVCRRHSQVLTLCIMPHSLLETDLLHLFWEVEEGQKGDTILSSEELSFVQPFKENHLRTETGRFIVPLPRKPNAKALGESRSQAVRRFLSLEHSLYSKDQFGSFNGMGHAELVPTTDLEKSQQEVFYLPMHAVRKETSSTTWI